MAKLLNKIRLEDWHKYVFYLFLFSIPFQTRKVYLTQYSYYTGAFTEYGSYFLYASDILLIITLILWLITDKKCIIGSVKSGVVERLWDLCEIQKSPYQRKDKKISATGKIWIFLLLFVFWLIINAALNTKYWEIGIYNTLKYAELALLFVYVYYNIKRYDRIMASMAVIIVAGFTQGLLAIYQFIYQKSLFQSKILHDITGESILGSNEAGIAKIIVDGQKYVRSYGTFPHPNISGVFLIISIIFTIYLYIEHKVTIMSMISRFMAFATDRYEKFKYFCGSLMRKGKSSNFIYRMGIGNLLMRNIYNNTYNKKCQYKLSIMFFTIFVILIQLISLFYTFSRSAWVGFALSVTIIILIFGIRNKIVSRETIRKLRIGPSKLFSQIKKSYRSQDVFFILISIFLLIGLVYLNIDYLKSRIPDDFSVINELPSNNSLSDRQFFLNVSRETISRNAIFGSGLGSYIFQIDDYIAEYQIVGKMQHWYYQPAHNIYFLIAAEIGIVGLTLFLLFVFEIMKLNLTAVFRNRRNVSRETFNTKNENKSFRLKFQNEDADFDREKYDNVIKGKRQIGTCLFGILTSFLLIGNIDHYFWTMQQGRLLFWLVLGLMVVTSIQSNEEII